MGGDTDTSTPTLRWDAVDHAVRYDLWIDNIETGQRQVVRETQLTDTTWTGSLPAGNYRAFVRAFNVDQENGNWSSRFEFTVTAGSGSDSGNDTGSDSGSTGDITTRTVVLTGNTHVPNGRPSLSWNNKPEGLSSSNESSGYPTLSWNRDLNSTGYDLWIDNISTGEAQAYREQLTTNTHELTTQLPSGTYRFWVRGISATGEYGDWSTRHDFTV